MTKGKTLHNVEISTKDGYGTLEFFKSEMYKFAEDRDELLRLLEDVYMDFKESGRHDDLFHNIQEALNKGVEVYTQSEDGKIALDPSAKLY